MSKLRLVDATFVRSVHGLPQASRTKGRVLSDQLSRLFSIASFLPAPDASYINFGNEQRLVSRTFLRVSPARPAQHPRPHCVKNVTSLLMRDQK